MIRTALYRLLRLVTKWAKIEIGVGLLLVTLVVGHAVATNPDSDLVPSASVTAPNQQE